MKNEATSKCKKPVFSGHETFPMRYGWLKKVFDACVDIESKKQSISKDLFNNVEAISILGVGKNMVSSMRHWGIYTGLFDVDNDNNINGINAFFRKIFDDNGLDPWMENYATLWLIHWKLATNKRLFTYYWCFNYLNTVTFDKDYLISSINEAVKETDYPEVSLSTLKRDVECFLAMYSAKSSKEKSNEESIESPLTELELIEAVTRRDIFQLKYGPKASLSIDTFLFGLLKFWEEYAPNSKTLSLEAMCYERNSPGRIFLLNENAIGDFIQDLSQASDGLLEWSETAGLKQIILKRDADFSSEAIRFFERNYE